MHDAQTTAIGVPIGRAAQRRGTFGDTLRRSQPAYVLLSPYLLLFVVILAYPLLYSIYLSFFDATLNRAPTFLGGGNLFTLFTDPGIPTPPPHPAFFSPVPVLGGNLPPPLVARLMDEE